MRWTILAPAQSDFVCYCFEKRLCACIFHQPKPSCTNFMSLILYIPIWFIAVLLNQLHLWWCNHQINNSDLLLFCTFATRLSMEINCR